MVYRTGGIAHILFLSLVLATQAYAGTGAKTPSLHNRATIASIDRELAAAGDKRYRAVLRGLRWCVVFNENDSNFDFTFTNYVTMLNELTLRHSHSKLKHIVHSLILREFARAAPGFDRLFPSNAEGYEDFIAILPIAYRHNVPVKALKRFAWRQFKNITPPDRLSEFRQAAKAADYDLLTDLIVQAAFVDMAYKAGVARDFKLPPNHYRTIMDECAGIPFLHKYGGDAYHEQNYYATHVLLALNHYGQKPFRASATGDYVFLYLTGQYAVVRNQLGDLDLLCEFLYCLRQFAPSGVRFISDGERYIMSRQNPDGSWGSSDDFNGDPYDKLHPTWTAITFLVQGSGRKAPALTAK